MNKALLLVVQATWSKALPESGKSSAIKMSPFSAGIGMRLRTPPIVNSRMRSVVSLLQQISVYKSFVVVALSVAVSIVAPGVEVDVMGIGAPLLEAERCKSWYVLAIVL